MPVNACCCTATPPNCGGCNGGSTPTGYVKLTFSGVTMCTSCTVFGSQWAKVVSGALSGAYCLPFDSGNSDASTCYYSLTTSIMVERHRNSSCTNLIDTLPVNLFARFKSTGQIDVGAFFVAQGYLFYAQTTITPNCVNGTYSNAFTTTCGQTIISPVVGTGFGIGGSVTLEMVNSCP